MTEINEEIYAAVGELSNMVAGHVTTKIAEMDKKFKVKFTEVKTGPGHEIPQIEGAQYILALPFRTTRGKVVIEVSYG